MLTLFPKSDPVQTDQVRYVLLPAQQLAWLNRGTVEARGSGDIDCVAPSGRRHARPGSLLATRSQRGAVLYLKEVRPHLVANTLHRIRQHDNDNALLKYVVIGLKKVGAERGFPASITARNSCRMRRPRKPAAAKC